MTPLEKCKLEGYENDLRRAAIAYVYAVESAGSEGLVTKEWENLKEASDRRSEFRMEMVASEVHES